MSSTKISLSRNSERDIKIRTIDVLLDGKHVGGLKYGESLDLSVSEGEHELKVTNQLKSASENFTLAHGEAAVFQVVGVVLKGIWTILWVSGTVPYKVELKRVS